MAHLHLGYRMDKRLSSIDRPATKAVQIKLHIAFDQLMTVHVKAGTQPGTSGMVQNGSGVRLTLISLFLGYFTSTF